MMHSPWPVLMAAVALAFFGVSVLISGRPVEPTFAGALGIAVAVEHAVLYQYFRAVDGYADGDTDRMAFYRSLREVRAEIEVLRRDLEARSRHGQEQS